MFIHDNNNKCYGDFISEMLLSKAYIKSLRYYFLSIVFGLNINWKYKPEILQTSTIAFTLLSAPCLLRLAPLSYVDELSMLLCPWAWSPISSLFKTFILAISLLLRDHLAIGSFPTVYKHAFLSSVNRFFF